ncbi:MAG: threonine aldolase family protein [Christensenellales bacterium]|jgi:threonine aldolase
MIRFECDYAEGMHPAILERLAATNLEQTPGYGVDEHCQRARAYIRRACQAPEAEVQFLVGGTQANTTVIAATLRPHQGVIAAQTGHINVHESGAIEATGHKVLTLPPTDGKITARAIDELVAAHYAEANYEHAVQPGMVYISQPTENGTLYSLSELEGISRVCRQRGIPLFVDGARMGYGLAAPSNDVTLKDMARLTDVFYIGGTKVGAMFGEAVVISNPAIAKDFRYHLKQRGGMLAKGRLLGVQFEALFEGDLYARVSAHAVTQALRIRDAFAAKGIDLLNGSDTNQQFPLLTPAQMAALQDKYAFSLWERLPDGRCAVRFCTSWATDPRAVDALIADIAAL